MKHVNTVVGRPYAVTTSVQCCISTADGVVIATCEPGEQVIFVAPCDVVKVSADEAHLTETAGSAVSAVSARRAKKALKGYVDEKEAALQGSLSELRELAQEAAGSAGAASAHVNDATLHLQSGEREKWNSSIPVGTILTSACAAMAGFLLCDGRAVSRTEYTDLYAAIGETYGVGDGESTFNLPDFRGRTFWGADEGNPLGRLIEAGLPNIIGTLGSTEDTAGAFQTLNAYNVIMYQNMGGCVSRSSIFDASLSNAIYGASDTVQPPAVAVNFFIKY